MLPNQGMFFYLHFSVAVSSFTIILTTNALQGLNTAAKVEKWLSSPSPKADKKSLVPANKVGLKRANPFQDKEVSESFADENTCLSSRQTPFCTPPSLPYCPDKVIGNCFFSPNSSLLLDHN